MRNIAAILLATLMLLAGCADDSGKSEEVGAEDSGDGADHGGNHDDHDGSNGDGSNQGGNVSLTNSPPTASIVASIQNGTIPFDTIFTLNGTDADGDNLTWQFDANGNGTYYHSGEGLPATVEWTFSEPGTFYAWLQVSDGTNFTDVNLTINALPATEQPYQHASGAISGDSLVCHGAPDTGTGKVVIDIDVDTWGEKFSLVLNAGAAHGAYQFANAAGTVIASGGGGVTGGGWSYAGNVPDTTTTLSIFACMNTFGETYTYEAGTAP